MSCLLKLVNLADNLIIIKLISCCNKKPLNLGAYLFVMKKIFSALSLSVLFIICSCQSKLGDPEVDQTKFKKTLWIGGRINIMRLCFPEIL
jgi:hypothetical protein